VAEAVSYGEAEQVLRRWGQQGVDVVFSTDSGFDPSLVKAARAFPNTRWVVMSDLASLEGLKNLAAHTANWCDVSYAAGVTAALVSKSRTVGLVTGTPIPATPKFIAGFKRGAEKARPGTKVIIKYSGDWIDPAKAAETTSAVIRDGADAIWDAHVMNEVIAKRVEDEGRIYVGSWDASQFAPKARVTSVILNYRQAYDTVARQIQSGQFKPQIVRAGLKEGFVKVLPLRLGHKKVQPTLNRLLAEYAAGKVKFTDKACAAA
jgi:simple sugar transport system substrate-binding protein